MIIQDSFLRDMAKVIAWYPIRWIISASPWSLCYFWGETVGSLDVMLSKRRLKRIIDNLTNTYDGGMTFETAETIARRIIQRHYIEHMEFYKFTSLNLDNLGEHLVWEGLDHLNEALRGGKGAILVHMHFGSKQFPLVALGLMNYPINQIGYRDPGAPDYSFIHKKVHLRIRLRIESQFKVRHIHLGKSLRPAYQALQRNEVLMITGDGIGGVRGAGKNYLPIRFLNKTVMFPPGPARIARKVGAALIPLFCIQVEGENRYRAVLEAPINQQVTKDLGADVAVNTQNYALVFEKYVTRYPDHWMFWEEFQRGYLLPES